MGILVSDIFYWFCAASKVSFPVHDVLNICQIINSCKIFELQVFPQS